MDNYRVNGKWRIASGLAFWGSTIQAIFNLIGLTLVMYLAYNLVDILFSGIMPSIASMNLDYYGNTFGGFIGGALVCFVIAFLGYLIYIVGVCLFSGAQGSENSKIKTRNIMLAELIGPVLTILFYAVYYASPKILVPLLDHYVATAVAICALYLATVIIPLVEFKALTKEETWSEKAQKGADDLKFSYSCILWGWGVFILALTVAAIAVYSSYTRLMSGSFEGIDKYGNTIQGITSITQEVQNLVGAVKIITMFASIGIFIFALLQTCYRISGWNKIKSGGKEEIAPTEEEEYEDEDGDKKKWMLWGSIAAGIIVIGGGLWALLGGSGKMEANANVFVDRTYVFASIENANANDASSIEGLGYGTPVENIADSKEDDIWTEVKFEQNGKTMKGFINKHHLMNLEEFAILDAAGLNDEKVRDQITERMHRLAIVQAAKSLDGDWTIEILDDSGTYANAKHILVRNASPSEQCFAFAMEKKDDEDERKAFVFSTPDVLAEGNTRTPSYVYSEDIPIEQGTIIDVTYDKRKKRYDVSYLIRYGYCGEDEIEDEQLSPYVEESITFYGGAIELSGQIDGKYDIGMTLYERYDCSISGWYKYLKNDIPIDLTGRFTETSDGIQHFELEEFTDGKKTGTFMGQFDGTSFTGKWVSPDGEKELPFKVSK